MVENCLIWKIQKICQNWHKTGLTPMNTAEKCCNMLHVARCQVHINEMLFVVFYHRSFVKVKFFSTVVYREND